MSQIDRAKEKLARQRREREEQDEQQAGPSHRPEDREEGGADRDTMSRREIIDYYNSLNIIGFENATQDDIIRCYTEMQVKGKDHSDIEEWHQKLDHILSGRAIRNLRESEIPVPFIEQIHHMLTLCGLSIRQWNEIAPTVQFDTGPNNQILICKMIYAVRYIGFDPAALLKKLIKHHRDGAKQPKISYQIEIDQDGETSTWVFSNLESFFLPSTTNTFLFHFFVHSLQRKQ